jgi:hypothetical protein
MKIALNSITFALFVKNLQNDHYAHHFVEGFLMILKASQGASWFMRIKVQSQTNKKQNKTIVVYVMLYR